MDFLGFNENSTIKEVRDFFVDENIEFIENRRAGKGIFDVVVYILLDANGRTWYYNNILHYYSTMLQNVGKNTIGKNQIPDQIKNLELPGDSTLQEFYEYISNNWGDVWNFLQPKGQKALSILNGQEVSSTSNATKQSWSDEEKELAYVFLTEYLANTGFSPDSLFAKLDENEKWAPLKRKNLSERSWSIYCESYEKILEGKRFISFSLPWVCLKHFYEEKRLADVAASIKVVCENAKCWTSLKVVEDSLLSECLITLTDELREQLSKLLSEQSDYSSFMIQAMKDNKQVIFTGAPGTGKTYTVRTYLDKECKTLKLNDGRQIEQWKFVQFHASYDYTDFVEGLRPVEINGKNTFVRVDGVFKAFCRDVVEYNNENEEEIPFYFVIDEINRADLGKVFGELMFGLEEDYRGEENAFPTQYNNLKTYCVSANGYFGEEINSDNENTPSRTIRPDVFENGFYVPKNIHIVGTMNDIDRSVESFDFALRRRFKWIEVKAEVVMEETLKSIFEDREDANEHISEASRTALLVKIAALNNTISGTGKNQGGQFGLTHAYHIGPSYFKEYGKKSGDKVIDENEIWQNRIESILLEYVRGRKGADEFIKECKKQFTGSAI